MAKSVSLPLPGRRRATRRRDAPSLRLPFLLTLPTLLVVFVIFTAFVVPCAHGCEREPAAGFR